MASAGADCGCGGACIAYPGERFGMLGSIGSWCSGLTPVERRAVERPSGR
jgi:hypothetical protein